MACSVLLVPSIVFSGSAGLKQKKKTKRGKREIEDSYGGEDEEPAIVLCSVSPGHN